MTPTPHANESETFRDCLRAIHQGARELQAALIERKPERILQAVGEQETSLAELERCRGSARPTELDDGERALLLETRATLRRNRMLATRFLDLIGQTLRALDSGLSGMGGYDAGGRPALAPGPRLVQRKV